MQRLQVNKQPDRVLQYFACHVRETARGSRRVMQVLKNAQKFWAG